MGCLRRGDIFKREQMDKCQVPGCRGGADLRYLGKWVCDRHWERHCSGKEDLRAIFKMKPIRVHAAVAPVVAPVAVKPKNELGDLFRFLKERTDGSGSGASEGRDPSV